MIEVGPDHQAFLRELRDARAVELWVATELLDAGLTVCVGALDQAATPWEASRFVEQNDIVVNGRHILEVKSSKYEFTCAADWPFAGAFVSSVKRYDARGAKPVAYVLASVPTRTLLVVSGKSYPSWEKVWNGDRRPERQQQFNYRAPVSELRPFEELVQWLIEQGP